MKDHIGQEINLGNYVVFHYYLSDSMVSGKVVKFEVQHQFIPIDFIVVDIGEKNLIKLNSIDSIKLCDEQERLLK